MKSFWKYLDAVMDFLTTIAMIVIAVICIVQILSRFIFKHSIIWANEASCFLFVYVVFMGAFILIRDKGFICMDLIQASYDHRLYNVPAQINSEYAILRCGPCPIHRKSFRTRIIGE